MKLYVVLTEEGDLEGVYDTEQENAVLCTLNEKIDLPPHFTHIVIPLWDCYHDEAHLSKVKKFESREEAVSYQKELLATSDATYEEIRIQPLQYRDKRQ